MSRPTLEEARLRQIAELSTDGGEDLEAIINWAEKELELAQNCFDKPRQARVAHLMINVSRLTLALSRIQQQAKG